nr:MAG TPA: Structural protein sp46 [Caudoviricetes sp.]
MNNKIAFLESVGYEETPTIGGFNRAVEQNTFDDCFKEACESMKRQGIDPLMDINQIIRNKDISEDFKNHVLSGIMNESAERQGEEFGNYANIGAQVSQLFDNCTNQLVKESTTVGQLMPIKAIDYPILVKQQLALATKDVMQTEVTSSPIVKKQIEHRWIVDNQTGQRWEYPQCFFKDEFREIFKAGKGLPIKHDEVALPLYNYDLIDNLTDATVAQREDFTFNTKIIKGILEDGTEVPLNMYIDLHLNVWAGGKINTKVPKKDSPTEMVEVDDQLTGMVDFVGKRISLTSASGQIKKVVFDGYLSNQKNERAVSMDYSRDEREWKIEDGHRVNVPYSVEELEDAKALLDMDLYKKTYDNIAGYLTDMEDSQIIDFLDAEYKKYAGIELDPLQWTSFVREANFDCDSTIATVALQSEYIENMLKFTIDRFLIDLTETAKLEDMTFVIYGNPKYISLLGGKVNWVIKNGQMTGGIKHNYGYGIMNTANVRIQVVSALKFGSTGDLHRGLRIIPYPLNKEQITFKHFKYSTHILTTQNSGYRAPDLPGGSMTNIMGVSRYESASIQGIQGYLTFTNDDFISSKPAAKRD